MDVKFIASIKAGNDNWIGCRRCCCHGQEGRLFCFAQTVPSQNEAGQAALCSPQLMRLRTNGSLHVLVLPLQVWNRSRCWTACESPGKASLYQVRFYILRKLHSFSQHQPLLCYNPRILRVLALNHGGNFSASQVQEALDVLGQQGGPSFAQHMTGSTSLVDNKYSSWIDLISDYHRPILIDPDFVQNKRFIL